MGQNKRRMLLKAFIISQFSYCPLVWTFRSKNRKKQKNTKNRVNKIHERALRLVYDDSPYLGFDELLIKDKSVSIHQKNIQLLATEIFKVKNGVSAGLTEDIFPFFSKLYDLRNNRILFRKRNRTAFYSTESLSSLAPRIRRLKTKVNYLNSKLKLKHWLPVNAHADCVKNIFYLSCSSVSILPSFLIPMFCIFLRDGFKMLMQILINFLYSICFT